MSKIADIEDIEEVKIHWSESPLLNKVYDLDVNEVNGLIVDKNDLNKKILEASKDVRDWSYDKTVLSIKLKNGSKWCCGCKFYLGENSTGLLNLINSGE